MDSNTIKKAIAEKADGVYQKLLKKSSDVFLNGDFNTITLLDDSIKLFSLLIAPCQEIFVLLQTINAQNDELSKIILSEP